MYNLGITRDDQKMAASLGGGMAVRGTCGAMIGAVMILGRMFAIEKGHKCPHLKGIVKDYIDRFDKQLCSRECYELRAIHKNDCNMIVEETARMLDEVIADYSN